MHDFIFNPTTAPGVKLFLHPDLHSTSTTKYDTMHNVVFDPATTARDFIDAMHNQQQHGASLPSHDLDSVHDEQQLHPTTASGLLVDTMHHQQQHNPGLPSHILHPTLLPCRQQQHSIHANLHRTGDHPLHDNAIAIANRSLHTNRRRTATMPYRPDSHAALTNKHRIAYDIQLEDNLVACGCLHPDWRWPGTMFSRQQQTNYYSRASGRCRVHDGAIDWAGLLDDAGRHVLIKWTR